MKPLISLFLTIVTLVTFSCSGGAPGEAGGRKAKEKHVADTGYTGVKNYFKGDYKIKEIEFRNGVKSGITRTYYKGGVIEQEINYSNGVRDGEARWYYPDSKLFRVTPYSNDTINGSQIQYYKSGRIKARINYVNGKRVPKLEEYSINGIKITDYPEIGYRTVDNYREKGVYKIFIEMSDLSDNVKYYRGDYVDGLVDLSVCTPLLQTATTGYLDMKKTDDHSADSVVAIAAYLTGYGNRLYYRIAVPLPYKDLN